LEKGAVLKSQLSVLQSNSGLHCTIGKNVKITNSIIMDYVDIEDKYSHFTQCQA
jgi:NDP-sugar pyrophosphorylase family protein